LHASGDKQAGLTSQYVAELREQGAWKGNSRHFVKWSHSVAINSHCSLEFQICFPTEHLRVFGDRDLADQRVVWIPAAPSGEMVSVNILFGPKGETVGWPGRGQDALLVCEGRLLNRRRVWIIARNLPTGIFQGEEHIAHLSRIAADMARNRMRPTETHRVVSVFRDDVGVYGFAELAGDAFAQAEQS
jgi:hypothetical protein